MKKIILSIVFVLAMGLASQAQVDGYTQELGDWTRTGIEPNVDFLPTLITVQVGQITQDVQAPLGSGLLVLTLLGAGYAVRKKSR